jgi:hypothetical protein
MLQFASTTLLDRNTCNSRGIKSKSSDILQSPMTQRRERKRKRARENEWWRAAAPFKDSFVDGWKLARGYKDYLVDGCSESSDICLLYTRLKDGYRRLRWNLLFQHPPLALCRFCNLMVQWNFLFIKRYICITIPNENLDTLIGNQVTSSKP